MDWGFAKLLFDRFLVRVSSILSVEWIHDDISSNKSVCRLMSLSAAAFVLQNIYKRFEDIYHLSLSQSIAENPMFIKNSMDFSCAVLKFSGIVTCVIKY